MSQTPHSIPSVTYSGDGHSTRPNELGMRPMQERAYQKRGEPYLLIKSPPASGKSRELMFIALDKLENQGLKQVLIVVPEKSIGASLLMEQVLAPRFDFRPKRPENQAQEGFDYGAGGYDPASAQLGGTEEDASD